MKLKMTILSVIAVLLLSACSLDYFHKESTDKSKANEDELIKGIIVENQGNQQQPTNSSDKNKTTTDTNQKDQERSSLTLEAKFFNQIQNVNGEQTIMNPKNILVMVNKEVALPSHYRPDDLIRPNVAFSFGNQQLDKSLMRSEAAAALEKMFAVAKNEGVHLVAASGFRSYETQDYLYKREIELVGEEKAGQAVAKPGTSEHQTGLTMDITSASMNYGLDDSFENKVEGKWLKDNAHRFGFIMRYPKGKEEITKYEYEPWHYRFVGVEIATKIYKNHWTLEEYFNKVRKI